MAYLFVFAVLTIAIVLYFMPQQKEEGSLLERGWFND